MKLEDVITPLTTKLRLRDLASMDALEDADIAMAWSDSHESLERRVALAVAALKGVRDYPMTPPSMVDLILEALAQIEEKK
jgi:hypothetical protein